MFNGRIAKVEIDYVSPTVSPDSATQVALLGTSGDILQHDARIVNVSGLESSGLEVLGGSVAVGGSAYTGVRQTDREISFMVECVGAENDFRNKVNTLKLFQSESPLYFRVTSTEGSTLHTYGYITDMVAPPFRKERDIQLTFRSPSPYFLEAPIFLIDPTWSKVDTTTSTDPAYNFFQTPSGMTQTVYKTDLSSHSLSPQVDVRLHAYTGRSDVQHFGVSVPNQTIDYVVSPRPTRSTQASMFYDSYEHRIYDKANLYGDPMSTHNNTPAHDAMLVDYGIPTSMVERNGANYQDWSISQATRKWPSPSTQTKELVISLTLKGSISVSISKSRLAIYNKVFGI